MDGSVLLTAEQRQSLLKIVRSRSGREVRQALIVLHSAAELGFHRRRRRLSDSSAVFLREGK